MFSLAEVEQRAHICSTPSGSDRNRVPYLGFQSLRSFHPRLYRFVAFGDKKTPTLTWPMGLAPTDVAAPTNRNQFNASSRSERQHKDTVLTVKRSGQRRIERAVVLQNSVGDLNQLPHRRTNDLHRRLPILP